MLLLAHSLRRYAGEFSDSPLLVLEPAQSPLSSVTRRRLTGLGASILPFSLPEPALTFPYAQKVYAAAEAEVHAGRELLVWMDADTVILDDPVQFALPEEVTIGCCPVQLKNISSLASEPPSAYWQAVYAGCETPLERVFAVTTTMDRLEIHAQFNAGLLVVRPQAGLLNAWKQNFERLYPTEPFQPFYAENQRNRVYIHQAVLSATLLTHLPQEAFRLFSEEYNAAIFLRHDFPLSTQSTITCRYGEYAYIQEPGWSDGLPETGAKISRLLELVSPESQAGSKEAHDG